VEGTVAQRGSGSDTCPKEALPHNEHAFGPTRLDVRFGDGHWLGSLVLLVEDFVEAPLAVATDVDRRASRALWQ
jgi:hypothetical protein